MSEAHQRFTIAQPEDVGDARRSLTRTAARAGVDERVANRAAIAVAELGSNLLRHAVAGGYLLTRPLASGKAPGIEVLAVDRGPGIGDVAAALRNGLPPEVTSVEAGGLGVGLGAVQRAASLFDIFSQRGEGTVVMARFHAEPDIDDVPIVAGVSVSKIEGDACGDRWSARGSHGDRRVLVVDGLGHGSEAAKAAMAAVEAFERWVTDDPRDAVLAAHKSMLGTRGGVLTVCRLDPSRQAVQVAGVGNITVRIAGPGGRSGFLTAPGTVGTTVRAPKVQTETGPWQPGTRMIMYTDGVGSGADPTDPILLRHHPSIVAAVLHRDHGRGTDDATVVVTTDAGAPIAS